MRTFLERFLVEKRLWTRPLALLLLLTSSSSISRRMVPFFCSGVVDAQVDTEHSVLAGRCGTLLSFSALCKPANYLRSVCLKWPYLKPEFLGSPMTKGIMKIK